MAFANNFNYSNHLCEQLCVILYIIVKKNVIFFNIKTVIYSTHGTYTLIKVTKLIETFSVMLKILYEKQISIFNF